MMKMGLDLNPPFTLGKAMQFPKPILTAEFEQITFLFHLKHQGVTFQWIF